MSKLYLKKLWQTTQFAAGFIFTLVLYSFLFSMFFLSILPLQKIVSKQILLGILAALTLVVMLVYIYRQRRNDKAGRKAYTKKLNYPLPSFGKDFWQTLKSRENIAHTLAFLTLDIPLTIYMGISAFSTIGIFLLRTVLLVMIQGAAFTLINTFLWCLAHRRWLAYWQNHAV